MIIPSEIEIAWYIFRYSRDFDGTLSDEDCFREIVYKRGRANLWQFHQLKTEMMQMSKKDIDDLKECFAFYGLL